MVGHDQPQLMGKLSESKDASAPTSASMDGTLIAPGTLERPSAAIASRHGWPYGRVDVLGLESLFARSDQLLGRASAIKSLEAVKPVAAAMLPPTLQSCCIGEPHTDTSSYELSYTSGDQYCTDTHQVTDSFDCNDNLISSEDQVVSTACQTNCTLTSTSPSWNGDSVEVNGSFCAPTFVTDHYECLDGSSKDVDRQIGQVCACMKPAK
jgi:hypothetical protein